MEKRLTEYLRYIEAAVREIQETEDGGGVQDKEEKMQEMMRDLLIQIAFFAHERLVHLIVTITFAILTMLAVVGMLVSGQSVLIALILLLMVLLVPYIRHYYILENGVQKLYRFYDELRGQQDKNKKMTRES